MPAMVRKRGGLFRVLERKNGRLVLVKRDGSPVDSGGHRSKQRAQRQARAVNASK